MKTLLAVVAVALLFSACALGGSGSSSGAGTGSITMYGTIDEGITFHK
jgi:ABC-type glycerol-3-phosphate transport system substrate-binding protein